MNAVAAFARLELWIVFGALFAIVGFRLLTGGINLDGLLSDRQNAPVSEDRVQLLIATIGAAGYLLISVRNGPSDNLELPSSLVLLLYGGSHGIYLFTKNRRLASMVSRRPDETRWR